MNNRKPRLIAQMDPYLLLCAGIAFIIGLVAIGSSAESLGSSRFMIVQIAAFSIGVLLMFLIVRVDYDLLGQLGVYIYICSALILLAVLFIGTGSEEVGTRGWIRLGPVGIQPSEIAKIGFILSFAKHADSVREDINRPSVLLLLCLHAGLLIGLILLQPDFGTAVVFLVIFLGILYVAGLSLKYFAAAGGLFAILAPLAWFFWLADFQKNRILTFFNPELDPLGSGYHVLQSKIAIGSGGVLGRGIGQGIQTQHGYLPEKQTDFIFAVIGEEMGMWGTVLVVAVLLLLLARCFVIASEARDGFGELLAAGVGFMLLAHIFESVGMCLGLLPVTGIPLPFVSYGGSNMLASILALALVESVHMRRKRMQF